MARFITCITIKGKKTVKVYEEDRYTDVMSRIFDDNCEDFSINYIRNMDDDESLYTYHFLNQGQYE